MKGTTHPLRILDFDIENRPLAYWYDGNTTAEVTAIAASWVGDERVWCALLGVVHPEAMLENFRWMYEQADIVTGHFIRKHDLPILNGMAMELKLPTLTEKLTQDTKLDLVKRHDLSMSQEALAAMYGMDEAKHHMTQEEWREANRLTPKGLQQTRKRVVDDVLQHKALRLRLLEAGVLKAPKMWKP